VFNRSVSTAAVIVITCCLAAIPAFIFGGWAEEIRDPQLDSSDVISRLKALSGPNAQSCGIFERKRNDAYRPGIDCASRALAKRSAFWVVDHGPGYDSVTWSGLAGNSQGKLWTVHLDTDVTAGHGASKKPVMVVARCVHPTIRARKLDCENWHRWD